MVVLVVVVVVVVVVIVLMVVVVVVAVLILLFNDAFNTFYVHLYQHTTFYDIKTKKVTYGSRSQTGLAVGGQLTPFDYLHTTVISALDTSTPVAHCRGSFPDRPRSSEALIPLSYKAPYVWVYFRGTHYDRKIIFHVT